MKICFALIGLSILGCGGLVASDGGGGPVGGSAKSGAGATHAGGSSGGGTGGALPKGGSAGSASGGSSSGWGGCGFMPEPTADCSLLTEVECVASHPRCIAMYDDSCCSMCNPSGNCADCIRYEFTACVAFIAAGCSSDPASACGVPAKTACDGDIDLDCLQKDQGGCEAMPGCVWALHSGCETPESCGGVCRPVTMSACDRSCEMSPSPCPAGYRAEGSGGAYFAWCIPEAMCP